MARTILVMVWVTILAFSLALAGAKFYNDQKQKTISERDSHIKQMGEACIHHAHNMSASANAELKDVYSLDQNGGRRSSVDNPEYVQWVATVECLTQYPLYDGQPNYMIYNTTLK